MAKYSETENWNRNVRTIAEHAKKFPKAYPHNPIALQQLSNHLSNTSQESSTSFPKTFPNAFPKNIRNKILSQKT